GAAGCQCGSNRWLAKTHQLLPSVIRRTQPLKCCVQTGLPAPDVVRAATGAGAVPAKEGALHQVLISRVSLQVLRICGVSTTACRTNRLSHCFGAVLNVAASRPVRPRRVARE